MKKKIAIVEDDRTLSDAMFYGLEEAGFEVLRAFDGEAGLALIAAEKPNLILLDILMPKMDGLIVANQLKRNPETKDIPIIILTVLDQKESVARAIESGVYDYFVKSNLKIEEIVQRVREKLNIGE